MKRSWIVGGWLFALLASTLLPVWVLADRIERNPLGQYVDPETGAWTALVYSRFFQWWLPIAVPVSLLAFACMFLNRPADRS
jgi:hypothetical protein